MVSRPALAEPPPIERCDLPDDLAPVTDGTIAVINLKSARLQSWSRFWRAPEQPGIAETIVEQELLTAQFLGDQDALDRLETLAGVLLRLQPEAAQTSLIAAQVASATHRFDEARRHLEQAMARNAPSDSTQRLSLVLDQATGVNLDGVLAARRKRAAQRGRWEELVPLGALLADLGEHEEAEATYHLAIREYRDVSPFALAWVCFELGMLWGERVAAPRADLAARWYCTAIRYLPSYVKARVHLAEILLQEGLIEDAGNLLGPLVESGDPEVCWRLAEVAAAAADSSEAEKLLAAADSGFESLLARHPLAFADHATEFYLAGGANAVRAFELSRLNLANRPTLRAYELAFEAALAAGEPHVAVALVADAGRHWGGTAAFRNSPLAAHLNARTSTSKAREGRQREPTNART